MVSVHLNTNKTQFERKGVTKYWTPPILRFVCGSTVSHPRILRPTILLVEEFGQRLPCASISIWTVVRFVRHVRNQVPFRSISSLHRTSYFILAI